jgi:hypothetical protein
VDDASAWDTIVSGAGSVSSRDANGGMQTLTVAASGGRVVRQTRASMPVVVGSARVVLLGWVPFVSSFAATNYTVRAGCFDNASDKSTGAVSGDGHFLQFVGGAWSIVRRSSSSIAGTQTDVTVAQASWNSDRLDGTGPSGYVLSALSPLVVAIEEGPTGTNGDCRVGVVVDGQVVWAHVFVPGTARPSIRTQRLPIRYEVLCTGAGVTSSPASANQLWCACLGDFAVKRRARTFTRATTARAFSTDTPMIAIRAQAGANRCGLAVTRVLVVPLAANDANRLQVRTVLNPTTLAGASYAAVPSSAAEIDVSSTAVTGTGTQYPGETYAYGTTIAGVADVVCVVARVLTGGAVDCSVTIEWSEDV